VHDFWHEEVETFVGSQVNMILPSYHFPYMFNFTLLHPCTLVIDICTHLERVPKTRENIWEAKQVSLLDKRKRIKWLVLLLLIIVF